MKKFIAFIVIIAIIVGGYFYYQSTKTPEKIVKKTKILRELPPKEVEIFDLSTDSPALSFTKTGKSESSKTAMVMPEVAGKVAKVNVKVGDTVNKNDILVELGNSLSTDIADIQLATAIKSVNITKEILCLTKEAAIRAIKSARIGLSTARLAARNADNTLDINEELLEIQLEATEDAIDDIKDQIKDTQDAINDLEDILDIAPNPEIEAQIEALEDILETLEDAKDTAKDGLETQELGIDLQLAQLEFALTAAENQLTSAFNSLETLAITNRIQELGVISQLTQAESAKEMAELNAKYRLVASPISGVVTAVKAVEGNLAAPGTLLVTVEDISGISIKTSVNEKERSLLKLGGKALIDGEKGTIISISPTLNAMTKKIDIEIEPNNSTDIIPGSFVKVEFMPKNVNKIFVPLNAVSIISNGKTVKIVENSIAIEQIIETGQVVGSYIEVTKGLDGNEQIVSNINSFVKDGDKVALK